MAISPSELQEKFSSIPVTQKIFAVIGLAVALAVTVAVVLWVNQPVYHILYTNLTPEDAGKITDKLKEMKIPYELRGDGTVMVPEEKVYELRLTLASEGLPSGGGVGFEIFDRTTIGMTDFVQRLNYRRALQGELARTIAQLEEVEHARVHLAIPERKLFSSGKEKPSASVVVKLRTGRLLSQSQVQGIVHLIASSVERLEPANVTIVDTHGNILSKSSGVLQEAGLANYQIDYQRNLEKSFEDRVESMLERAIGPGKVVVRVSSNIDFKQVEIVEEKYDPDNVAIRSEQRAKESSTGSLSKGAGVPGVLSNIPGGAEETSIASGSSSQSKKVQETINYEINKVVNRVVEPMGRLKRLSVAVLVDGSYEIAKGEDGKEVRKYIPRTEEELQKYTEIVKKAIGYSEERGDQVKVVNIPFESDVTLSEGVEGEEGSFQFKDLLPFVKYIIAAIAIVLTFLFVVRPLMKILLTSHRERKTTLPGIAHSEGVITQMKELEATSYPQLSSDSQSRLREEAIKIAKDNPQQTAKLIKAWIEGK